MAYGIRNLQRSSRFDMLTPGGGGDDGSGTDYRGSFEPYEQQDRPSSLYDPADQGPNPDTTAVKPPSGLAKIADVSIDTSDESNERLKRMIGTIQGSYKPDVYSRDRNDRLLDNFPERGQPTKMDRFNAIMLSLGQKDPGEVTEKVLQAPYYRDRADWVAKSEPFYKAAQLENTSNTNERQILGNAIAGFSAGERTMQAQNAANDRYELGVMRLNLDEFKAKHPDWKYDTSGPRILAFDPTGQQPPKDLGPTGKLTELERLNIQGTTARDVATIGANSRVTAAGVRAAGGGTGGVTWYRDEAGGQFKFNGSGQAIGPDGQPYVPRGDFNKIPTEPRDPMDTASNQAGELKLRMGRVYATQEGRNWLIRNNDGSFTPKPRPTPGLFSDNAKAIAEYDAVMKAIWPDWQPSISAPTPAPPSPQSNNASPWQNSAPPTNGGPPIKNGPGDGTLRARAAEELRKRGKVVSQETIDEVIRRGLVK